MQEPTIKLGKVAPGEYRVVADWLTGRMEYVGHVERRDGLWHARAGGRRLGPFRTRGLAIAALQ